MKRTLLAALAVFSLAGSAHGATYTFNTNAGQEAAITDARAKYNASAAVPDQISTNAAYIMSVLTAAVQSYAAQAVVRPPLTPTDRASLVTILNAAIARADGNSAAATALLAQVNAAQ